MEVDLEVYKNNKKFRLDRVLYLLIIFLVIYISICIAIDFSEIIQNKKETQKIKTTIENKLIKQEIKIIQSNEISKNIFNEIITEITETTSDKIVTEASDTPTAVKQLTAAGKEKLKNIYSQGKKIVYFTFDDGPSTVVTPLILDVLKTNNIKATFFVLGSLVKQNPEIAKRLYDEGHYIGNHGYSHIYKNIYNSVDSALEEFNMCEAEIRNAIGVPDYNSFLFRFPGGFYGGKYANVKKDIAIALDNHNIGYLDWNALSKDSEGKYTKEELLKNIKETSYNKQSVVILMHDAANKILTYEILQEIIDYFKNEGYEFGNMYDIIV